MSALLDRMMWSDKNVYPDLRVIATYGAPSLVPLTRIGIYPGMVTYEDMQPLITSDGAPVAATGQGTWGQLYKAGKY